MVTTSVLTGPSTTQERHRYPSDDARLTRWRHNGWLTAPEGSHDADKVFDQMDWLGRLADSGRVLDDEDAAAGWRLRRLGCDYGLRVAGNDREAGRWLALWSLEAWFSWPEKRPYVIAKVLS